MGNGKAGGSVCQDIVHHKRVCDPLAQVEIRVCDHELLGHVSWHQHAIPAAKAFAKADAAAIQSWIAAYRADPTPDLVPALVRAVAAKGLLQEQDRAGIYIGFVAGVLSDNQPSAEKLVTAMFPLAPPAQVLIIKAIAYSGLPEWKDLLGRFVERMPARQILNGASTFTPTDNVQSASLVSVTGPRVMTPALLIMMSRPPSASAAAPGRSSQ